MKADYFSRSLLIFLIFTFLVILSLPFIPAIPQNPSYHNFADSRTFFDIHHFLNIYSNIFFIIVGALGLYKIFSRHSKIVFSNQSEKWPYVSLFIATILTGFGSGYYHAHPNNMTMIWDRIPMTMIMASYFSAMLMERINRKVGLQLLLPLMILGIMSVIYWQITEIAGHGDLRLYGWSQFYPTAAVILLITLFPSSYTGTRYIIESYMWYGIAKIAEFFDQGIYVFTHHLISGHTIKHIAAAIAIYSVVRYLTHRKLKYV